MAKIVRSSTNLTELLAFYGREAIVLSFGKVLADSYVRKSIFRISYQLTCEWPPSWTILCRAFLMRFPSVTVFSSFVNIVYSVISVYRLKKVFGFAFSLAFLLQMVFSARCVCSKHDTWRHGEVVAGDLRVAAVEELRFCDIDSSKNKGRKRKICGACRGRIATELKCLRLEVT